MARRTSKHLRPARPLFGSTLARTVTKSDGDWITQSMTGQNSTKEYLCPGCNRTIPARTPHIVAWPVVASLGSASGLDERRHWHHACWNRRR